MCSRFLAIAAIVLYGIRPATAGEVLTLAYNEDSAVGAVGIRVIQRVFDRIGVSVVFVSQPAARATLEASNGTIDGEIARIASYGSGLPEMVRVDPPWVRVRTVAYANAERHLQVRSAQDLAPLSVGIVRGIQHAAQVTKGLPQVTEVVRPKQLFDMLIVGRFDVAVDSDVNGRIFLQQRKRGGEFKEVAEFGQQKIFLYLHRRHSALLIRVSRALEESRARGELDRWVVEAESAVADTGKP